MTDTSREAVERLLQDVTPGPWYLDAWDIRTDGSGTGAICDVASPNGDDDKYWKDGEADANARFIAAARELVPALLKERDAFRDALRADLTAALQRELMQMQRADEAEVKLAVAVEALLIAERLVRNNKVIAGMHILQDARAAIEGAKK